MKLIQSGYAGLIACMLVAGCGEREVILPGERLDIRTGAPASTAVVNETRPIRLAAQNSNSSWPQRGGSATHSIQHPAFGTSPVLIWSASIGQGNDRRHRITADPVVADNMIVTLDSRATVSATSRAGAPLWSRDLTRPGDSSDDASGGGLALSGGQVFVTTAFGEMVALNATTGAVNWRQALEAPATGSPTVSGDLVYTVGRDGRGWAVRTSDGRVAWQVNGTPSLTGITGSAGPAVSSTLAVFPFSSTELTATMPQGGLRLWSSAVAGGRRGVVAARITDVSGDPVIRDGVIYSANPSGRTDAFDRVTGAIIWSAEYGATGPVWVDGGSVFLVSDRSELVRLDAGTGARIWGTKLPYYVPVRRQKNLRDIYTSFGPILAGGRLWVASGDKMLRGFDPASGALTANVEMPTSAASRPVVAGGIMYIVGQNGQLLAFR